jgi:succinoglycan biosynthesis transport protein ExoP
VAATSPPATTPTDDELSLTELLQLVHRRRWMLLGCMLLGGLVGMGIVATVRPVYVARSLLIIEPDGRARTGTTVASSQDSLDSASVDSQVQILASRSLAREAIGQLRLDADPELTGAASAAPGIVARLLPEPLAAGSRDLPSPPADVVGRFLDRLAVKREGKSHVIAIAYRSGDPAKAAAIANKLAELYMVGQLSRKYAAARRQSGWLDEHLATLKRQRDEADAALQRFRAATEAARGETYDADPQDLAGLSTQLVAATVERAAKESTLERARRLIDGLEPAETLRACFTGTTPFPS